ncbi:MAG: hypothetical protein NUV97_01260 [archaeon]|nr:hypothetical protein [archaeon]MCR4323409.1 hypothetical protein [Nanoarchaeota archaeon]
MVKKSQDSSQLSVVIGICLILGFILFWLNSGSSDNSRIIKDYTSCVEWCVSDQETCMFFNIVYDNQRNAWMDFDEVELCNLELEGCVEDCAPNIK